MTLLETLRQEKEGKIKGGIYHRLQVEMTYNSNHMEGSRLTQEQTQYIYETNTVSVEGEVLKVDDIVETVNHFRCIDLTIEEAEHPLSEELIKGLHRILKTGTSDSRKDWFAVGEYKKLANEVGMTETTAPEEVPRRMEELLHFYTGEENKTLEQLLEFHYAFERIHPFQDGNGRVGRLILLKECLRNNIVPFIISDDLKYYYYRGLREWKSERGYLRDTCLTAQDRFKKYLDYFGVQYTDAE